MNEDISEDERRSIRKKKRIDIVDPVLVLAGIRRLLLLLLRYASASEVLLTLSVFTCLCLR